MKLTCIGEGGGKQYGKHSCIADLTDVRKTFANAEVTGNVNNHVTTKTGEQNRIRNKQRTIKHNFVQYSYSYMFQPHGVINRLAFRTY
jgi:hypothetical protein